MEQNQANSMPNFENNPSMNPPIQLLNDNQSVTSAVYNEAQPKYANPLMNNASIMSNMYGNQNLGNSGMLN